MGSKQKVRQVRHLALVQLSLQSSPPYPSACDFPPLTPRKVRQVSYLALVQLSSKLSRLALSSVQVLLTGPC
jgi:hypothetical protein